MKNNLMLFFKRTALACVLICTAAACIEEDDVEVVTERFFVAKRDWVWNNLYARWECLIEWRYMTEYIYDQAAVVGSVYVNEKEVGSGREYTTAKNMPFVQTFSDGMYVFTENISFDVSPGAICFYIQNDELDIARLPFQSEYEFKVVVILEHL